MQPDSQSLAMHSRCKFEFFRFMTLVCMSSVIDYGEIFWAIVFMAKIGHSAVQGCLPTFRGNLEVFGTEVELVFEEHPQFVHLKALVSFYS